jgi:hypothetical protein
MRDVGGIEMPDYFGKMLGDEAPRVETPLAAAGESKPKDAKPEGHKATG